MSSTVEKAVRKRIQRYHRAKISLSPGDQAALDELQAAYTSRLGYNLSLSILVSVALAALTNEVRHGNLRSHIEARPSGG